MKTRASDATDQTFARHRQRFLARSYHTLRAEAFSWHEFFRSRGLLSPDSQQRLQSIGVGDEIANPTRRAKAPTSLVVNEIQPAQLGKIIVGHNLKRGGDRALQSALIFAEQSNASIRLIHVVNPRHHLYLAPRSGRQRCHVEGLVSQAGRQLRQIVAGHQAKHVRINYEVRVGKPAWELVFAGRAWPCDLIIVGGSARPSIQFLSGTAERLVRTAFVPVLVAHQALKRWPQRILIPTDFSPASRKAAEEGVALAKRFGGRVFFLHVFDPTPWYSCPYGDEMVGPAMIPELDPADVNQEWTAFLQSLSLGSLSWDSRTEEGLPKTGITRYADKVRADMIVMGTHGRTALERILCGSVTEAVVRTSAYPVLTIKPCVPQRMLSTCVAE